MSLCTIFLNYERYIVLPYMWNSIKKSVCDILQNFKQTKIYLGKKKRNKNKVHVIENRDFETVSLNSPSPAKY